MNNHGTIINLKKSSPCWVRWQSNSSIYSEIIENGIIGLKII